MKKLLSIVLIVIMMSSLVGCSGSLAASTLPNAELNTLNAVFNAGFKATGVQIAENVYAQTVANSKGEEFVTVVKVADEQLDAFNSIDFLDENAQKQYLDVIGDNEFLDVLVVSDALPDKETLDAYKGQTIADFEFGGAEMSGYAGDKGKYNFYFSDSLCDYKVSLEKGAKIEDYDEMELFDAAIQNLKIESIEATNLSTIFLDEYIEQFLDAPEKVIPAERGIAKASLDEINRAVGSNIKAVSGATNERFSVIDEKIAQYIYVVDGIYYCVRSTADTNIDLTSDDFSEYPLVDENGYTTTAMSQNDVFNSVRFVFNGYQYAYMAYDNGEFDWNQFDALQQKFRDEVCEYPEDSVLHSLVGIYSSDDGYTMSITPVSAEMIQISAYTYSEQETKYWTMLAKISGSKLAYDKCKLEIYTTSGNSSKQEGKGTITMKDGVLTWQKHNFTLVQ